jgi:hypothetical protein
LPVIIEHGHFRRPALAIASIEVRVAPASHLMVTECPGETR